MQFSATAQKMALCEPDRRDLIFGWVLGATPGSQPLVQNNLEKVVKGLVLVPGEGLMKSDRVQVSSIEAESNLLDVALQASVERAKTVQREAVPEVVSAVEKSDADVCPHCQEPFEIVHVTFKFNGTSMIACCPNCAVASASVWAGAGPKLLNNAKKRALAAHQFWQGVARRMASLDQRFRYVLAFLAGAVITAAALRHGIHIYGGIPREDIRTGALMAIPLVALAIILFRRWRRH
jgi:hypothetical protein